MFTTTIVACVVQMLAKHVMQGEGKEGERRRGEGRREKERGGERKGGEGQTEREGEELTCCMAMTLK